MPPARTPLRRPASVPGYQATTGTRPEQAAHDVLPGHPLARHIDEGVSAHPLRHTFVTTLVRGGTDLVTVSELAGHARLETTRAYSLPTDEDKTKALNLLITDQ